MAKGDRKPYEDTRVHWGQSLGSILGLLERYGCKGYQHTYLHDRELVVLQFVRVDTAGDDGTIPYGVRIELPGVPAEGRERNRRYRVMFYYLKSKFEALEHGLVDFATEFLPYLMVGDGRGGWTTMAQHVLPQYQTAIRDGRQPLVELDPRRALGAGGMEA